MNRKILILLSIIVLVAASCSKLSESDQMEIDTAISQIEQSINMGNSDLFSRRSDMVKIFTFFSQLVQVTRQNGGSENGMQIKALSYKGSRKKTSVAVSMNYNIDLGSLSAGSDIPVEALQQIVAIGLPEKATFVMELKENGYKLAAVKWPLKYFYMNLLIN